MTSVIMFYLLSGDFPEWTKSRMKKYKIRRSRISIFVIVSNLYHKRKTTLLMKYHKNVYDKYYGNT